MCRYAAFHELFDDYTTHETHVQLVISFILNSSN